jgi:hypothetical protein
MTWGQLDLEDLRRLWDDYIENGTSTWPQPACRSRLRTTELAGVFMWVQFR